MHGEKGRGQVGGEKKPGGASSGGPGAGEGEAGRGGGGGGGVSSWASLAAYRE